MQARKLLLPAMITTLVFVITSCSKTSGSCSETADCASVTFSGTIQPLASTKCAISGCHGGSFDSYANMKSLADDGQLFTQVVDRQTMPDGGIDMSCLERAQFECWINAGAPNN